MTERLILLMKDSRVFESFWGSTSGFGPGIDRYWVRGSWVGWLGRPRNSFRASFWMFAFWFAFAVEALRPFSFLSCALHFLRRDRLSLSSVVFCLWHEVCIVLRLLLWLRICSTSVRSFPSPRGKMWSSWRLSRHSVFVSSFVSKVCSYLAR